MKIIFTILLIFYGLILITRYVGPILLRFLLKRIGKKMGMAYDQNNTSSEKPFVTKEETKPKKEKVVGEYIDFEEID